MKNIKNLIKCGFCNKDTDSNYFITKCKDLICEDCFIRLSQNFKCPNKCCNLLKSDCKKIRKERNISIFFDEKTDNKNSSISSLIQSFYIETKKYNTFISKLKDSQKNILDLLNSRFDFINIILTDIIASNRKRKKKFKELFDKENLNFLKITSELDNTIENIEEPNYEKLDALIEKINNEIEKIEKLNQEKFLQTNNNNYLKHEEENTDILSSRRDCISSNRLLISEKTRAFNSMIKNEELKLFKKPDFPIPELNEKEEETKEIIIKSIFEDKENNENLISPEKQKNIIIDIIKKEYGLENYDLNNYNLGNKGKENQSKFLIEGKWWRCWIRYINNHQNVSIPGKILNINLINEESLNSANIKSCRLKLKDNLLEHHDYEAVSKNMFKYFKKWYDFDYDLIRFLKKDPLDNNELYLDLSIENKAKKKLLNYSYNAGNNNKNIENTKPFLTNLSSILNTQNNDLLDVYNNSSIHEKSVEFSEKKDNCLLY